MTKSSNYSKSDQHQFGERIMTRAEQAQFERDYRAAFNEKPDYLTQEYSAVNDYLSSLRGTPYSDQ